MRSTMMKRLATWLWVAGFLLVWLVAIPVGILVMELKRLWPGKKKARLRRE